MRVLWNDEQLLLFNFCLLTCFVQNAAKKKTKTLNAVAIFRILSRVVSFHLPYPLHKSEITWLYLSIYYYQMVYIDNTLQQIFIYSVFDFIVYIKIMLFYFKHI